MISPGANRPSLFEWKGNQADFLYLIVCLDQSQGTVHKFNWLFQWTEIVYACAGERKGERERVNE